MRLSTNLIIKRIIPFLFVTSFLSSCYYDNQDELHPVINLPTCDTTGTISYTGDIVPLLNTYCGTTNSSCHTANHSSSSIALTDYQSVQLQVDNGKLLGSIQHQPGYVPMPFQTAALNSCDRQKIEAWVHKGSLNN
jgi:hypothetical protein